MVALEKDAKYDVSASGNDLVLTVGDLPAASDPNVVLSRDDAQRVKNPAHKLTGVKVAAADGAAMVRLAADGEVASFTLTELQNPGRLAVDLHGISGKAGKAQGALPIMVGQDVIGAIGISGAPGGDKDEACAKAGIDRVAAQLR